MNISSYRFVRHTLITLSVILLCACAKGYLWVTSLPKANEHVARAHALYTHADGTTITTGEYVLNGDCCNSDLMVSTLDSDGNVLWHHALSAEQLFGSAQHFSGQATYMDSAKNSYVLATLPVDNAGGHTLVLLGFTADGSLSWHQQLATGVRSFGFAANEDAATIAMILVDNGSSVIRLLRVDANGQQLWSQQYSTGAGREIRSIDVADSGEIALTLSLLESGELHFYSENGTQLWVQSDNRLAGYGDVDFDHSGHLYSIGERTSHTYLVQKMDFTGTVLWEASPFVALLALPYALHWHDGRVYAGLLKSLVPLDSNAVLVALDDNDGSELYRKTMDNAVIYSSDQITGLAGLPNHRVAVTINTTMLAPTGSPGQHLYILDDSGKIVFKTSAGQSGLGIDAQGGIYTGGNGFSDTSSSDNIYKFDGNQ